MEAALNGTPAREASSSLNTERQTDLSSQGQGRWLKRHIWPGEDERWYDVAASGGDESPEDDPKWYRMPKTQSLTA